MAETYDRILLLITDAVADALDTRIEDIPPLSESIDVDGLDAVMSNTGAEDVRVVFSHAGLWVFVHSSGFVYARPMGDDGGFEADGSFAHVR